MLFLIHSFLIFSCVTSMTTPTKNVVIIGGGIHGSSVAYYLATKFGQTATVVERSAVGAAASGKAGGFLAREWGSGPTTQLHKVSYDLHQTLARELNIESYRVIPTLSVDGNVNGKKDATWLDRQCASSRMPPGTAQVTPLELTQKLLDGALAKGSKYRKGVVTGIDTDASGAIRGVRLDDSSVLAADVVVVALGPWTSVFVEDNFGMKLPMEGVKSTSIVYNNVEQLATEPFALFCAEDRNHCHLEFYPRSDSSLYVCGCGGSDYVSGDRLRAGGDCASPELIEADPRRVAAASSSFRSMSSVGDREPAIVQACMRPCTPDALPAMGKIDGFEGAYVSAGHNCWGILWAPASGLAMAELIMTGKSTTIDLRAFDPNRFEAKAGKRGGRGKKVGTTAIGEQW
jgi:glycine/D-amino acid oxidase-like deaminating enzyme